MLFKKIKISEIEVDDYLGVIFIDLNISVIISLKC